MKLLVGLGNPGKNYNNTRHNIGFAMIDFLFSEWLKKENFDDWGKNTKFKAEISVGNINGEKIILAKPLTFMNNSGETVQALASYFKIPNEDIYVFHDELDLLCGNYKIQFDRSGAGHNGVLSIIEKLGTQAFNRIRIGIAKEDKQKQGKGADYVLNKFNLLEKIKLKDVKKKILDDMKKVIQ
mgnify:CR=1 FL=1